MDGIVQKGEKLKTAGDKVTSVGGEVPSRHGRGGRPWNRCRKDRCGLRLVHEQGGGGLRGDGKRLRRFEGQGAGDGFQDEVLRIRGCGCHELHGDGGLENERHAWRHRGGS